MAFLGSLVPGYRIEVGSILGEAGSSIASVGDIDGDGLSDLIIGAPKVSGVPSSSGAAFVVCGSRESEPVRPEWSGKRDFRISGKSLYGYEGTSVSAAGDVNGDGLMDFLVGAPGGGRTDVSGTGSCYLVFGGGDFRDVSLASLGSRGVRIDGIDPLDRLGASVSGIGDFNGDAFSDFVIGARTADAGGRKDAGEAYIIFGDADFGPVNLADLGTRGVRIPGLVTEGWLGACVAGAGDVNGDGLADVVLGAPYATDDTGTKSGVCYVILGSRVPEPIELSSLGNRGYRISGTVAGSALGMGVSGAGDVNGDGLSDVILGAPGFRTIGGSAIVLFGGSSSSSLSLSDLGTSGFVIRDSSFVGSFFAHEPFLGRSVAGAGDLNGDGLGDVLVAAPNAFSDGSSGIGVCYVVYGKAATAEVDVVNLGTSGYAIPALSTTQGCGKGLCGAGDANGDGSPDIALGTPIGSAAFYFGSCSVLLGIEELPSSSIYRFHARAGDAFPMGAGSLAGDTRNTSAEGRCWIDFPDGEGPGLDGASLQTVGLHRLNVAPVIPSASSTAKVAWSIATNRVNYSSTTISFRYTDEEISRIDESSLALFRGDSLSGPWTILSSAQELNANANLIRAVTPKLEGYYVLGGTPSKPIPPVPDRPKPIAPIILEGGDEGFAGFRINGAASSDYAGNVSAAGDVNGDGLADLLVGAVGADPRGRPGAGVTFVVFGKEDEETVDLSAVEGGGFRILGAHADDSSGSAVCAAGDVNGDGLGDIVIGVPGEDGDQAVDAGAAYVVFGKRDDADVDLAQLEDGGFRMAGISTGDFAGGGVSGAGDVNGDGLSDLIVGAPSAGRGECYVIFGKADAAPVLLRALGSSGFRITTPNGESGTGNHVSGAGDVNGDGLGDVIVYTLATSSDAPGPGGAASIIFGKADSADVNLGALDSNGFKIKRVNLSNSRGGAVAGAGDSDGDGRMDLLVGSPTERSCGDGAAGESYLVFGTGANADIDAKSLGAGGFTIKGNHGLDLSGNDVSCAGDVNGDGLPDVIIGRGRSGTNDDTGADEAYLVFGKNDNSTVGLSTLLASGFLIKSLEIKGGFGMSVSGAGDVNGDGRSDVIIGEPRGQVGALLAAGVSLVVFGPAGLSDAPPEHLPAATTYKATAPSGDAPRVAIGITGDGTNDSTPDSRCWIDFADGSGPGLNGASIQNVELLRSDAGASAASPPEMTADVAWHLSTNRSDWAAAEVTFRYLNAEIVGIDEETLRVYQSSSLAGPWSQVTQGLTRRPANNTIRATVTSMESYFALVGDPLPQAWFLY